MESAAFERIRPVYLDDDEYAELQDSLRQDPGAGRVVPGSGGVRKLRWKRDNAGKRGGLRIVYFVNAHTSEIWMLTLYSKSANDNVPAHVLKRLLKVFRDA